MSGTDGKHAARPTLHVNIGSANGTKVARPRPKCYNCLALPNTMNGATYNEQ